MIAQAFDYKVPCLSVVKGGRDNPYKTEAAKHKANEMIDYMILCAPYHTEATIPKKISFQKNARSMPRKNIDDIKTRLRDMPLHDNVTVDNIRESHKGNRVYLEYQCKYSFVSYYGGFFGKDVERIQNAKKHFVELINEEIIRRGN